MAFKLERPLTRTHPKITCNLNRFPLVSRLRLMKFNITHMASRDYPDYELLLKHIVKLVSKTFIESDI